MRASQGVGVLPLVLAAGAGAGASVAGGYAWRALDGDSWLAAWKQAYGGAPNPAMKPAPAPQFKPPPAPQTAAKLTSWSPADLAEAAAQRSIQFSADMNYLSEVMAAPAANSAPANSSSAISWLLIGVVAIGAAVVVFK